METEPLVSIIVPVYNREKLIFRAVKSCLRQSHRNIEILVIDDGSSDNTLKMAKKMEDQDERVRVLGNSRNRGVNYCRNVGLMESKGQYVNFLDSDDVLCEDKLRAQLCLFEKDPSIDCVVTHVLRKSNEMESRIENIEPANDLLVEFIGKQIKWKTISPLWRKSFLEKVGYWRESLASSTDYEYYARAVIRGAKAGYLHRILAIAYDYDQITDPSKIRGSKDIFGLYKNRIKAMALVLREVLHTRLHWRQRITIMRFMIVEYLRITKRFKLIVSRGTGYL
jgi:glycosyltransferase involved in cell wall biosynthesis